MTSYVLGHKIYISEKSLATLLKHDGSRRRCFGMITKKDKILVVAKVIFKNGKPYSNVKDLYDELRI